MHSPLRAHAGTIRLAAAGAMVLLIASTTTVAGKRPSQPPPLPPRLRAHDDRDRAAEPSSATSYASST